MLIDSFIQGVRQRNFEILFDTELISVDRLRMVKLIHLNLVQVHLSMHEILCQPCLLDDLVKFGLSVCKVVDVSMDVQIIGTNKHGTLAEENYLKLR